ncbi:MAG TPA: inorganic pyrophosphatase [Planctomycetota bacterium]|nr:inorganic pyrophosphatase [Planctomycetota bacterium]
MSFPEPFYAWRPHPWHGISPGPRVPEVVQAYIEITPFDLVKYEIDKVTGFLRIDRPQRSSSSPPSLYGFIPRTLCGKRTGALSHGASGGDGDPLDICVLSERPINAREILVTAKVIGGLTMLDKNEADDKIVAVLASDLVWGDVDDLAQLPAVLVERLRHYFSTYKLLPDATPIAITPYAKARARQVIEASLHDYRETFGGPQAP